MTRRAAIFAVALLAVATGAVSDTAARPAQRPAARATVARVIDGDTIELTTRVRVRLVQIDTPEVGSGECFSRAAARELRTLLPGGAAVMLEADPRLDRVDRYGRLLRYVIRDGLNANLELVRRGAATVWFYEGERGRYATQLITAATAARKARRGLWGACPRAVWDPLSPASTGPGSLPRSSPQRPVAGRCDPSYPTVCIPPPPPDLDCRDIPYRNFRVLPPDPHRFDGGGDGWGCET